MNMLLLTGVNFIVKGFNSLTFMLDKGIYSLAKVAYSVFYYISNATILNDKVVNNVTIRVYTILSILMVFVLAFNLLNYIVDPDKINDKKIGTTTFVKDVVIALIIIAMTPMLFTKLYSLQSKIITSGVLSNIILGSGEEDYKDFDSYSDYEAHKNDYSSLTDYYIQNGANSMVASIYVAFLYPNDGFTALDCRDNTDDTYKDYCTAYANVKRSGSISPFEDFINKDDYNFTPLLTTAAGCVLLYFMFIFCISLGKRVGKMAIIQLIAPIPVTLELLPNKKGLRKNWIDTLIKVYLEVFIYLLVMYLIIFLISLIPDTILRLFGNASNDGISLVKIITVIILIFGLLLFAKDAPKMLMDLLGIKSTGLITDAIKGGKAGAGWAALLGGTAGSMLGNAMRNYNATNGNVFNKGLSAIGGASSTFFRNAWGARNVHSIKDANNLRRNVNKTVVQNRVNRDAYVNAHGGTLGGSIKGLASDYASNVANAARGYTGMDNEYQKKKHTEQVLTEYKKLYNDAFTSIYRNDAQYSQADAEFKRYDNMIKSGAVLQTDVDATTGLTYAQLRQRAQRMRDARQGEVLKDKKLEFMEAAGKLNNFIDAHQGVAGISKKHIDIEQIGDIRTSTDALNRLNDLNQIVKNDGFGGGFDPELDGLKRDTDYQTQRVQEKLREDAKQANKKAAEQASNKNDKK